MKRTILMVFPEAFHLGWLGATRRLFHLAESFVRLGFDVVLLARRMGDPRLQQQIDIEFPGQVLRTRHTGDYPILFDGKPFLERAWRMGWKMRGQDFYWSRLSWGWVDRLDTGWVGRELQARGAAPVLIWGICGGYLEGGTAADRLAKEMEVPWVFELQDPPRGAGLGTNQRAIVRMFRHLLSTAHAVVVTADTYKQVLVSEYAAPEGRVHTIHLTYEDVSLGPVPHESRSFTVVYAGGLGGGRTIVPLLEALRHATGVDPDLADSCRLVLAGKGPGFDEARRVTESVGWKIDVEYLGHVPASRAAELLRASSVSVIVQPRHCFFQIPGKLFECLSYLRPVLGIMPSDCEAAILLRRSGLGFVHEEDDVEGIRDSLLELWQAWREGRSAVEPDLDFIGRFSIRNLPAKLSAVLKAAGIDTEAPSAENVCVTLGPHE